MSTLMYAQKQNFRVLARCPTTGDRVWGNSLIHLSIRGHKVVWWYCPTCQSWHVLIIDEEHETS